MCGFGVRAIQLMELRRRYSNFGTISKSAGFGLCAHADCHHDANGIAEALRLNTGGVTDSAMLSARHRQ